MERRVLIVKNKNNGKEIAKFFSVKGASDSLKINPQCIHNALYLKKSYKNMVFEYAMRNVEIKVKIE